MFMHYVREDRECILLAFASTCVVGKNLNTPDWSVMAGDATTGGPGR